MYCTFVIILLVVKHQATDKDHKANNLERDILSIEYCRNMWVNTTTKKNMSSKR